jgi:hypothetical protein
MGLFKKRQYGFRYDNLPPPDPRDREYNAAQAFVLVNYANANHLFPTQAKRDEAIKQTILLWNHALPPFGPDQKREAFHTFFMWMIDRHPDAIFDWQHDMVQVDKPQQGTQITLSFVERWMPEYEQDTAWQEEMSQERT